VGIGLLVVLVVGGTWFGWRAWRGVPVSLTVDGAPILNAEQVLAQADPMFRELARIDGATLPGGAACWFAPPPKDAVRADQPRVACGPVLLGISGDKQRWVVGTPSYSATTTGGSRGSTGTFGAFDGVEELRPALLARPDGKHPPDGEPGLGAAGVRTVNGRIIVDAAQVVQSADRGFAAAASKSGAAVGPDSRCYLGVRDETRSGVTIAVSDGNLWCGPVLRTDSAANATWASFPLALKLGQSIVEATAGDPSISEVTSTKTLPAGMRAYRADGLRPPDGAGGLQVPDSDPVKAGTIAILDELPSTVGAPAPSLMVPPDGRLVTPSVTVQLTGIGRLPKVGSGTDAFVAPKGEGLAVATFQITREAGAPSGNGTATLIVDGVRIAVRDWSSVKDGGALVASVPIGSRDIVLEVLAQGRAQGISLVTGQRTPGGPSVPYRRSTQVSPATPIEVAVRLPKGDPVRVTGTVGQLNWQAWDANQGWAPVGQAFLLVTVDDWKLVTPCCDVSGVKVATTWRVRMPDGTTARDTATGSAGSSSSAPKPRFVVPEAALKGTVTLEVAVTYVMDGAQRQAVAPSVTVPFLAPT